MIRAIKLLQLVKSITRLSFHFSARDGGHKSAARENGNKCASDWRFLEGGMNNTYCVNGWPVVHLGAGHYAGGEEQMFRKAW